MGRMVLTVAIVAMLGVCASADVYKCPDGKGGVVFGNIPCDGTSQEAPSPPAVPTPPVELPRGTRVPIPSPHAASDATCATLGEGAANMVILRDRGTPASVLLAQFTAAATKTPGVEGVVWEEIMRHIILQVYKNTWWTPAVARQRIELFCFERKK